MLGVQHSGDLIPNGLGAFLSRRSQRPFLSLLVSGIRLHGTLCNQMRIWARSVNLRQFRPKLGHFGPERLGIVRLGVGFYRRQPVLQLPHVERLQFVGVALLAALGSAGTVEGSFLGELYCFENASARNPDHTLAALHCGQGPQDRFALRLVGLALNPCPHLVAVLRTGQLQQYQPVRLAEDVLVQNGGALGDEPGDEALHPPAPHDFLHAVQHSFVAGGRLLRREAVGLVNDEVEWINLGRVGVPIDGFQERSHEPALCRLRRQFR